MQHKVPNTQSIERRTHIISALLSYSSPLIFFVFFAFPAGIYLLKINSRDRTMCEICLKLTIKAPGKRHWRHSSIFVVNFEFISLLVLVFLLLTLNM